MRMNLTYLDTQVLYHMKEYDFIDSVSITLTNNRHLPGVNTLLIEYDNFNREDEQRLEFYHQQKCFDLETSINMSILDRTFPDEVLDTLSYMEEQYREWRKAQ